MAGRKKQSEYTFVTNSPVNAKRKPEEEWEDLKDIILGYYDKHTLEEVMRYMGNDHEFRATKRQYIHRLSKWGVKKYNKGKEEADDDHDEHNQGGSAAQAAGARRGRTRRSERQSSHQPTIAGPSQQPFSNQGAPVAAPQGQDQDPDDDQSQAIDPYLLNLNYPNAHFWYSLLANSHYAFGDSQSAFQIQAPLYRHNHEVSLAVTCARSAQVKKQVKNVRVIIEEAINRCEANENSWDRFLFGALLAHNWEQVGDRENAFEQFGDLLENHINLSNSQFKHQLELRVRSPGNLPYNLDILAYIYLRHAVLSFNKDDLNIESDLWLDAGEILRQFLEQQPVSNGVRLSCLEDCLEWCVANLAMHNTLLEKSEPLPINLETIPGDSVYKVVCLLWNTWVRGLQQPQAHLPQWSMQAEEQLSISAAELFVLVVCTIMATPLPKRRAKFDSAVADALFRARILKESSPKDLLNNFLIQVQNTADQRMATEEDVSVSVKPSDFDAIREVFSGSMPAGYTLPSRHHGYIHPLIVRDQDESKAAVPKPSTTFSPSPSLSLYNPFANAQYGAGYGGM